MDSIQDQPPVQGKLLQIARKEGAGAPMETLSTVAVSELSGIEGDYRGQSMRRQVTVLASEAWKKACEELTMTLPWTTRRANLLVEGVSLTETTGKFLQIGDLTLEVTGETKPCDLMDRSYQGLREKLVPDWRGGVTCRVIHGGTIQIGDAVRLKG